MTQQTSDDWYQPKGGLCVVCEHWHRGCEHLDFSAMPVVETVDAHGKIVKCTDFKKKGSKSNGK